jgi:hypothetical protein
MRIISLLVAFCFSFNVMASSGTVQELERAMDEYHYGLSVEWDQKDPSFFDLKTKEFFSKMEGLIKIQGLSQEQIMTLVEKKVNNKKVVEALKLKMSLLGKGSTAEELARMIKDSTKEMYAQGASWNGEVVTSVVIGLLVAAVVGYSIWWNANHVCVAYETQYVCDNYCNDGGFYRPDYSGSHCLGGFYSTCGYAEICTDYVRK